jgi:hypothetical protein
MGCIQGGCMYHEDGFLDSWWSPLAFGALYYLGSCRGHSQGVQEMKEKSRDEEIENLKRQINDLKKSKI